ncbi:hypothetical protein FQN53_002052 [Emmonsiellopsis sp. PD_33]|nr:hypothetical protein FQN53_002052 [Emmonsiellopsis sp. PD_33]
MGRQLSFVATKTTQWGRPDALVEPIGNSLTRSDTEWEGPVPEGTKEICAREAQHPIDEPRKHLTVVCLDEEGKGKSQHVPFIVESK